MLLNISVLSENVFTMYLEWTFQKVNFWLTYLNYTLSAPRKKCIEIECIKVEFKYIC